MSDVGLYGLAVMGQNFALNMASKGFTVSVCNRSPDKVDATVARAKSEGDLPLKGYKDPKDFIQAKSVPVVNVVDLQTAAHLELYNCNYLNFFSTVSVKAP
eukprot:21443-Heterococcus_DN1.PRE.1